MEYGEELLAQPSRHDPQEGRLLDSRPASPRRTYPRNKTPLGFQL